jgi:phosphate transport system substrate-binding protein
VKKQNSKIKPSLYLFSFILLYNACNDSTNKKTYNDTATSGEINIAADESFSQITNAEIDTFHALYKNTKINVEFLPENDAFARLISDSVRCIIAAREVNDEEKKYFKSRNLIPRTTHIATDAIAFIVNSENSDTLFSVEDLRKIISGEYNNWNQLGDQSKNNPINIIFDNQKSSTARYLKERFLKDSTFPANCFAVNTNPEVIKYVKQNKNAIGIIGVSWISDGDDPATKKFLDSLKVVSVIAPDGEPGEGKSYKPYQAFIAQKFYPFTRNIYVVSREARMGLGTGFTAFVAGDKGQRIILKSGIMPATQPVRIVGFRDN